MQYLEETQLIRQLHQSPLKIMLAVTGGGSEAISNLLKVPGASQTILETLIPYSSAALDDFLKRPPEHYCSDPTARAMAMSALIRARYLLSKIRDAEPSIDRPNEQVLGVGCTASLKSTRSKLGDHRVHLAIQSIDYTSSSSLVLIKGERSREEEEILVSGIILDRLAYAAGLEGQIHLDLLPGESFQEQFVKAKPDWKKLLLNEIVACSSTTAGVTNPAESFSGVLMPGAFNPWHDGHRQMAEMAEKVLGRKVDFELSIENVEKPPLDYIEIDSRLEQFQDGVTCWLTRAPTFVKKSNIFPEAYFVVGADTIVRIADPKFYHGSEVARDEAIREISDQNCRFLVFPRLLKGQFSTLKDMELPSSLLRLCEEVPASEFRADISSTDIRKELL